MKYKNLIHPDLLKFQHILYNQKGLLCTDIVLDGESQEYGACTFKINNKVIKFRAAKITPTKTGQFVTFWKRINSSPIMPYDTSDMFDFLVISVRHFENCGQFIFPKSILEQKGVLSKNGCNGKRAIRVYPPWDIVDNAQAKKTQEWQLAYFVHMEPVIDIAILENFL